MNDAINALAPCPFCGCNRIDIYTEDGENLAADRHVYVAQCYDCAARIDPVIGKTNAVERWNTRASTRKATVEREAIALAFLTGMHGKETAEVLRRSNGVAWNDVLKGVDAVCKYFLPENREAIARAIRGALVENWNCAELGTKWNEDVLLTGCKKVGNGKGYQNPEQAAQNLALDAADAILARLDEAAIRADEREKCAKIADAVRAPTSIGRDKGRHHEAGAQHAASAIRGGKQP